MKAIVLIVLCFLLTIVTFAQQPTVTSTDKFNKRGIIRNGDLTSHGKEVISDYDGNLMVNYGTHLNLGDDLSGDFVVMYNSNVSHRVYDIYNAPGGNNINAPEWIIGYKGFALQTLNFETNFYYDHFPANNNLPDYMGEEIPLIIPGYHFSNTLSSTLDNVNANFDEIKILMVDGSLTTLRNVKTDTYKGIYKEEGVDTKGFAIVTGDGTINGLRTVYYKPGDGLTYVFHEEMANYYGLNFIQSINRNVKILYLDQILAKYGYHVDFIYDSEITTGATITYGRKVLKRIDSNTGPMSPFLLQYPNAQLMLSYTYTSSVLYSIYVTNYNHLDYMKLNMDLSTSPTNLLSNSRSRNSTRMIYIGSIQDSLNRIDNFTYYINDTNYNRKFTFTPNVSSNTLNYNFTVLKKINYSNNKETDFVYYPNFFTGSNSSYVMDFSTYNSQFMSANVNTAFRDPFTNFMLISRKTYNKYNTSPLELVKTENYSYSRIGSGGLEYPNVNNIITTITTNNNLPPLLNESVPSSVTKTKTYSKYNVRDHAQSVVKHLSTIKLMSESTSDVVSSAKTVLDHQYNIGVYRADGGIANQSYYDGFFTESNVTESRYLNSTSQPATYSTGYSYVYNYLLYKQGSIIIDTTILVLSKTTTDPQSLTGKTSYVNYLINSSNNNIFSNGVDIGFSDSYAVYKVGLPVEQKSYSGSTIKSDKTFSYYTSGDNTGRLLQETDFANSRPITKNYNYYSSLGYYLLGSITDDRGAVDNYYYTDSENAYIIDYNKNKYSYLLTQGDFQTKPFKTTKTFQPSPENGTIRSLTSLSLYDYRENPVFTTGPNLLLTKYFYDALGRTTNMSLPGSFTNSSGATNYSTVQAFNDASNTINITNRFVNNVTNNNLETEMDYDAFGQLRKVQVQDNPIDPWETKTDRLYNYLGLVSQETDGMGRIKKYGYDYLGRVTQILFGDGSSQAFSYNPGPDTINSRAYYEKDVFTDENGKTKETFYDRAGNKIAELVGGVLLTQFYYDNVYRLTSTKTPMSKTTSYTYDDHNNISQKTSPDEGTYQYKYDKHGNLRFTFHTTQTPYQVVFTTYDQLDRVFSTGIYNGNSTFFNGLNADVFNSFEADTSKKVLANIYDEYLQTGLFSSLPVLSQNTIDGMNLKGRLVATAFRDKPGDTWNFKYFSYDHLGNVNGQWIKLGGNGWKSVTSTYDQLSNLTYQNANNDMFYWYYYDHEGRMSNIKTNNANTLTGAVSEINYSYNTADQQTTDSYPSMLGNSVSLSYGYDTYRGWVNNITRSGSGFLYSEALNYNPNGNVSSITLANSALNIYYNGYTYTYDNYNRMTDVNNGSTEHFAYDNDGNITYRNVPSYKYYYIYFVGGTNKLNYIYNGAIKVYSYDYKGNVIADDMRGTSGITYDHRNLPLSMTGGAGTYYYRYDDGGNRIYKQTGSVKEFYLRDHTGRELAVYDMNTNKIKLANIFGNGGMIGRVDVTWLPGAPPGYQKFYYLKDHLGSTRVEFDRYANVSSAYSYYAYGQISSSYNNSNPNDKYKFTGKERDTETNYDYFGARYYDSELGRWMSVDPLAAKNVGISPYNYANNNPLYYVDPTGGDTYSYSILFIRGGGGPAVGYSLSWKWDDNGNSGLFQQSFFGAGIGFAGSSSLGISAFRTKSNDIFDLIGYGLSASFTFGPVTANMDVEHFNYPEILLSPIMDAGFAAGLTYTDAIAAGKSNDFSRITKHILNGGKISLDIDNLIISLFNNKGDIQEKIKLQGSKYKGIQKNDNLLENGFYKSQQDNTKSSSGRYRPLSYDPINDTVK